MANALEVLIELEKRAGYDRNEEISISEFHRIVRTEKLSDGVVITRNPSKTNISGLFAISHAAGGKYKTIITAGERATKEEKVFASEGLALNYLLYRLRLKKQQAVKEKTFTQQYYRF